MRKLFEKYTLALITLGITFIMDVIANFALKLSIGDQFIVIAVGLMATLIVAAIEREVPELFGNQVDHKLEVYTLLAQIDDTEFRDRAQEIIADCKYNLRQLADGRFGSYMSASPYERGRLYKAKHRLRAVYLGTIYQGLGFYSWRRTPEEKRYYQENLEMIRRGIEIVRVFILRRNRTVNDESRIALDDEIVSIMKQQRDDGIKVRIAWEEDITSVAGCEVLKDFVVLDNFEVDAREYTPDGNYEVVIWKNPIKVREYEGFFYTLYSYSMPLDDFLADIDKK